MLASKSRNWHRSASSPLAIALTVSLCAQCLSAGPAQALSFIAAKKSQLQTPTETKLDEDSGPSADTAFGDEQAAPTLAADQPKEESKKDTKSKSKKDTVKKEVAKKETVSKETAKKDASKSDAPVSLAPLTLSDEKASNDKPLEKAEEKAEEKSEDASAGNGIDKQYMKLHAETMGISPKGPLDGDGGSEPTTLPSKSLKSELGSGKGKLIDQAKNVNVQPLALMDTDAETDQKVITDLECERAQISELWEATLTRNQDIQFVVQKLMPSSDKGHATTVLMRMISSTLVAGASGMAMMSPSPMGYATTQAGSSMVMNMMGLIDSKQQKRAAIDQGQAISLYKMVRDTADKVTENYRDYKKYVKRIDRAKTTTENLQNMIQDARAGQDAAKQIEMEYWVSRAKGDVEEAVADARRYRQSLIDLAGSDAVNKLDQSLNDQLLAEQEGEKAKNPVLPVEKKVAESKTAENKAAAKPKYTEKQMQAFDQLLQTQGGSIKISPTDGAVPQ